MILRQAVVIFFLLLSVSAEAQILDDTTRQIYGTGTTRYVLEEEILNNQDVLHRPDTALNDFHNLPFLYGRNTFYQDLGVIGTAVNFYTPDLQERPLTRLGYDVYTPYAILSEDIKYYDTRSPFSEIFYLQGSRGQQYIRATYSRNINPRWNIGFDFRKFGARRIIGLDRRARQVNSNAFAVYTRYNTKDETYQLLANFTVFDHIVYETGGIRQDAGDTTSPFGGIRENVFLDNARSFDKRFNYHLFHQVSFLKRGLQFYHIFDATQRFNRYKNVLTAEDDQIFYDSLGLNAEKAPDYPGIDNHTIFHLVDNQLGFKGELGDLSYRFWYRNRNIFYTQEKPRNVLSPVENFIGGRVSWDVTDSARAYAEAELSTAEDYLLSIQLQSKYLKAGLKRLEYTPALFFQQYYGNIFQWNGDSIPLQQIKVSEAFATLQFKRNRFFINATGKGQLIDNYVFLNQDAVREQAEENEQIQVLTLSGGAGVNFLNFHLENYLDANFISGQNQADTLLNLPPVLNRTRLYYQNRLLKAALFQLGIDINYRAGYFADKYMPVTQHYYLNRNEFIESYFYTDFFLNMEIQRVVGFAKMTFVDESLFREGYFITPGYTGMPRTFYFGILWRFYD